MSWLDALLAYAHFISIIAVVATVAIEAVLCRPGLTLRWAQRLGRIDLFYLVTALLAVTTGLLRVFFGAKGVAFYVNNPIFWVKITLFIVVGLISIIPTLRFIRWTRTMQKDKAISINDHELAGTARIIYLELALLAFIPLMGSLMARGFGFGWW
jgi:putative membrane protein